MLNSAQNAEKLYKDLFLIMSEKPLVYICPKCVQKYSSDGICEECNISLVPLDNLDCPECGAELKKNARHCSKCGTVVQSKCKNCGTILDADDAFCPDCGTKTTNEVAELKEAKTRSEESDLVSGEQMIDLVYNPRPLHQFHEEFPFLREPETEAYEAAIEKGLALAKEPPVIVRLGSYPRRWAIQRPGSFRRALVMLIDTALWIALLVFIMNLVAGGENSGGLMRSMGVTEKGPIAIFRLIWFISSYFIYTIGAEYVLWTTVGGLIMGTRVVDEYGNKLSLWELIKRSIGRLFAPVLFLFGGLANDHEIVIR